MSPFFREHEQQILVGEEHRSGEGIVQQKALAPEPIEWRS
jgi:hypothetical protein